MYQGNIYIYYFCIPIGLPRQPWLKWADQAELAFSRLIKKKIGPLFWLNTAYFLESAVHTHFRRCSRLNRRCFCVENEQNCKIIKIDGQVSHFVSRLNGLNSQNGRVSRSARLSQPFFGPTRPLRPMKYITETQ